MGDQRAEMKFEESGTTCFYTWHSKIILFVFKKITPWRVEDECLVDSVVIGEPRGSCFSDPGD